MTEAVTVTNNDVIHPPSFVNMSQAINKYNIHTEKQSNNVYSNNINDTTTSNSPVSLNNENNNINENNINTDANNDTAGIDNKSSDDTQDDLGELMCVFAQQSTNVTTTNDNNDSINNTGKARATTKKRGRKNSTNGNTVTKNNRQTSNNNTSNTTQPTQKYNRKEKSLSLLCDKFLAQFDPHNTDLDSPINQINLDNRAAELQVERRRVYDIVNILESINMVSKKGKNLYLWHGATKLYDALQSLYTAVVNDQVTVVEGVKLSDMKHILLPDYTDNITETQSFSEIQKYTFEQFPYNNEVVRTQRSYINSSSANNSSQGLNNNNRNANIKEHSLGNLSQLFVCMFFSTPVRILSLEDASLLLLHSILKQNTLDRQAAQSSFKSKVRRLYDIANVLTSTKLIEKVHVINTRKSAFRWRGSDVFTLPSIVDHTYAVADNVKQAANTIQNINNDKANKNGTSRKRAKTEQNTPLTVDTSINNNSNNNTINDNYVNNNHNDDLPTSVSSPSVQTNDNNNSNAVHMKQESDIEEKKDFDNDNTDIDNLIAIRTAYYPNPIPQPQPQPLPHVPQQQYYEGTSLIQSTGLTNNSIVPYTNTPCLSESDYKRLPQHYSVLPGRTFLKYYNASLRSWISTADKHMNDIKQNTAYT